MNSDPARLDQATLSACETDLWLVDLAQSDDSPLIDNLMENAVVPVLFGEGHAPERHSENYPRWERRLFGKLKKLVGDPSQAVGPSLEALLAEAQRPSRLDLPAVLADYPLVAGEPARQVWLLAASFGRSSGGKGLSRCLARRFAGGLRLRPAYCCQFENSLPQAVGGTANGTLTRPGTAMPCAAVKWWWCRSAMSWASMIKARCR